MIYNRKMGHVSYKKYPEQNGSCPHEFNILSHVYKGVCVSHGLKTSLEDRSLSLDTNTFEKSFFRIFRTFCKNNDRALLHTIIVITPQTDLKKRKVTLEIKPFKKQFPTKILYTC